MAKYEKFEEWMVGKKVIHDLDLNDEGVLLGDVEGEEGMVRVRYEKDGDHTAFIEYLNFLEGETPPDITWEVGQVVWDVIYGKGVVSGVKEDHIFPVKVKFDDGGHESYTFQGSFYESGPRSLFFSETKIIAETMPPKKPFVPKLKEGDKVAVFHTISGSWDVVTVLREEEDKLYFKYVSGQKDCYNKQHIHVKPLGEEIVFD